MARQIKSKLLFYGIRSPFSAKGRWSKQYLRWVKGLLFEREVLKVSFQSLMELYEYLSTQLVKINKKVIELSWNEKYLDKVRLLRSVPGIGILIAMELLVELPERERFKSGDELASYMGLTPSEYSIGQDVCGGRELGSDHEGSFYVGPIQKVEGDERGQEGYHCHCKNADDSG